jgi:hypothetical protein
MTKLRKRKARTNKIERRATIAILQRNRERV